MQSHDLTGRQIGPYELTRKLGAGGMGAVYESYQASVQRRVAIKVLPTHLAQESGYLERFKREVELAARLEHPHILPVYDHGTVDDISYIVMRMLRGGTLTQRLRKEKQLAFEEAVKILRQIGSALDYAHQENIIHRDLKPSNVMFDKIENAYLTDFGISKLMQESTSALTGTGQLIGTPSYMAPEQWEGLHADARTDLYALGVLAYTILTGQTPFEAPTPLGLMRKHMFDEPTPPSNILPDLPMGIDGVIAKSLAKRPDDRFQSAKEFVAAMIRSVHGEVADVGYVTSNSFSVRPDGERVTKASNPTPAINKGDLEATITDQMAADVISSGRKTVAAPSGQEMATELGEKPAKGRGGLLIGVVLLVIAVIAVGAIVMLTQNKDDGDQKTAAQRNAESTSTAEMATVLAQQDMDATATEAMVQSTQTLEAAANADATIVAEAARLEDLGDDAYEANNFAEAVVRYSDAINQDPSNAGIYVKRAQANFARDNFESALEDANQAVEIDNEFLDAYLIRGDILVANGSYGEAIEDYTVIIENSADNHLVLFQRAKAYAQISETESALLDLETALEANPDYAPAFNTRGDIYADEGDLEQAIEAYTQAIRIDPGDVSARFSRGVTLTRNEQYDSARVDFLTVLDLRPDFVESYRGLGDLYYIQGDLDLALENYQIYLERAGAGARNRGALEDRVEEIHSAIATANAPTPTETATPTESPTPTSTPTITPTQGPTLTPTISEANQQRAQERLQDGIDFYNSENYDQAIVAFTDAINLDPTLPVAYNNRGVTYQALENYAAALDDYLLTIEIDPNYALAYSNAGGVYYLQGQYGLALEYYELHIELAGDNPSSLAIDRVAELETIVETQGAPTIGPTVTPRATRTPGARPTGVPIPTVSVEDEEASNSLTEEGDEYYGNRDYQAAILSYNAAIALNPGNTNAINNRGNSYFTTGLYEAALLDYNRAIQINPDSAIFYYNRGNTHRQLDDFFSALQDYDEAIYLDDQYSSAYFGRGYAYYLIEDYDLALSDFGISLELGYSASERVYNLRGLAYYQIGNNAAARADFNRAIDINPNFESPYYNMGNLNYDEGNWAEALEFFQQYVERADTPAQDALDRIDELNELVGN